MKYYVRDGSLCALEEKFAFLSGGRGYYLGKQFVQRYDFKLDKWQDLPDMLDGRFGHSSCAMANTLYVFHGYYDFHRVGSEYKPIAQPTIEQMSFAGDPVPEKDSTSVWQQKWTRIELRGPKCLLDNILVHPLNTKEFLLLQGSADTLAIFNLQTGR